MFGMRRPFFNGGIFVSLLIAAALASSCWRQDPPLPPLPEGEQTVEGVLQPAEISLMRRGSHTLVQNGEDRAFVESTVVNLRAYDGKRVTLRGIFERNVEPSDLPVLIVREIVSAESDREWIFPQWGLSFTLPSTWTKTETPRTVQFRVEGWDDALLTLANAGDDIAELPAGQPLVVARKRAVSVQKVTGEETVFIELESGIFTMSFNPGEHPLKEELRAVWENLKKTATIVTKNVSSVPRATGSGSGIPCGGPAGVLCPGGEYCAITDRQENVGRCRPMGVR